MISNQTIDQPEINAACATKSIQTAREVLSLFEIQYAFFIQDMIDRVKQGEIQTQEEKHRTIWYKYSIDRIKKHITILERRNERKKEKARQDRLLLSKFKTEPITQPQLKHKVASVFDLNQAPQFKETFTSADIMADEAMNSIKDKFLAGKSFADIAAEKRAEENGLAACFDFSDPSLNMSGEEETK